MRRVVLLVLGSALLSIGVLASPLGRLIDRRVSAHFVRVNQRRAEHRLTTCDTIECLGLYHGIALVGRVVSSKGGAIVWHYLHGKGDLDLDSSYLRKSPVILRSIRSLKPEESGRYAFHQADDWRLSYALNPFSLRRDAREVHLWERIAFGTDARIKTKLRYGLGVIELPDALIHVLHPKTFTVRSRWRI